MIRRQQMPHDSSDARCVSAGIEAEDSFVGAFSMVPAAGHGGLGLGFGGASLRHAGRVQRVGRIRREQPPALGAVQLCDLRA